MLGRGVRAAGSCGSQEAQLGVFAVGRLESLFEGIGLALGAVDAGLKDLAARLELGAAASGLAESILAQLQISGQYAQGSQLPQSRRCLPQASGSA